MSHLIPEVSDGRIDAFPVAQASLSDLNLERIKAHIANARERDKLDEDFTKTDDIHIFLQRFGCVVWRNGELVPTAAGILMFGHRPQFFFPHADVGLGHFPALFRPPSMHSIFSTTVVC